MWGPESHKFVVIQRDDIVGDGWGEGPCAHRYQCYTVPRGKGSRLVARTNGGEFPTGFEQ